jgi:hypothetical protein
MHRRRFDIPDVRRPVTLGIRLARFLKPRNTRQNAVTPQDRIDGFAAIIHFFVALLSNDSKLRSEFIDCFNASAREARHTERVLDHFFESLVEGKESTPEERQNVFKESDIADELHHSKQISAATILLVIDEMLRRLAKGLGLPGGVVLEAGPLLGVSENPAEKVTFTSLVAAGANSFRHLHEWEELDFERGAYVPPTAKGELWRFEQQIKSIEIIRAALQTTGRLELEQTFEVLKLASTEPTTRVTSYETFRDRLIISAREMAESVGLLSEFEAAQRYHLPTG